MIEVAAPLQRHGNRMSSLVTKSETFANGHPTVLEPNMSKDSSGKQKRHLSSCGEDDVQVRGYQSEDEGFHSDKNHAVNHIGEDHSSQKTNDFKKRGSFTKEKFEVIPKPSYKASQRLSPERDQEKRYGPETTTCNMEEGQLSVG